MLAGLAVESDELQDRRRPLDDRQALELHLLRQLRQRGLHAVVDVDRVDVGIGAEREADGQVVAAVVAAGRLHVDHLVDADDLRLDRLGDGRLDHRGRRAGIDRGDLHLRRHDVGELRDRDAQHREQRPASVMTMAMTMASRGRSMKSGGDHRLRAPAGAGAAGGWPRRCRPVRARPAWPGRTRWMPSTITLLAFGQAAR